MSSQKKIFKKTTVHHYIRKNRWFSNKCRNFWLFIFLWIFINKIDSNNNRIRNGNKIVLSKRTLKAIVQRFHKLISKQILSLPIPYRRIRIASCTWASAGRRTASRSGESRTTLTRKWPTTSSRFQHWTDTESEKKWFRVDQLIRSREIRNTKVGLFCRDRRVETTIRPKCPKMSNF